VVGVPLTTPDVVLSVRPGGSACTTVNVLVPVAPWNTVNEEENARPTSAVVWEGQEILGGETTVMVHISEVPVALTLSLTVAVNV
jgi:hypothetical protein